MALKTIHAAAVDLGLTQAAVTKRIQALEEELGVNLFLRSRRGMAPTEEGTALLQFCKVTQEAEGELLVKIKGSARQETSLTIVGPTSVISTRITDCCIPLYSKFPFLRLNFRSDDHANRVEVIRRGEADLAVISPEQVPNEMDSKLLKPERYVLIASAAWRSRALSEILEKERAIDFYESDLTTPNYLKHFGLEKQAKRSRLFTNENDALIRLFSAGVGYGTLTEEVAKPFIDDGKLIRLNRGQGMDNALALVWIPRSKRLQHFDELVRLIK